MEHLDAGWVRGFATCDCCQRPFRQNVSQVRRNLKVIDPSPDAGVGDQFCSRTCALQMPLLIEARARK